MAQTDRTTERLLLVAAGYFLVVRPILEKLNIVPDAQEQQSQQDTNRNLRTQQQLQVPAQAARTYQDQLLSSVAKLLYDSTDKIAYDYATVIKCLAYGSGMRNADALFFLKTFAQRNGQTLYQWYKDDFANASNFQTLDLYISTYNRYSKNYAAMGYRFNWAKLSFDDLAEAAVNHIYRVAKIPLG